MSSLKAIGTQQIDYGDSLFIIHTRTTTKQKFWSHTYATTVDQWIHGTLDNIDQYHSKTYQFLPSDPLLPNQTHPSPVNQG